MSLKLLLAETATPLGDALLQDLEREPFNLLVPGAPGLDWFDAAAVSAYIQQKRPEVVVNNIAWEALDTQAGRERYLAAASHLAAACGAANIPLIQLSSYRLFAGDGKSTHGEKDVPNPLDDAGRTLVAAEIKLAELAPRHICLRFSWLIGPYGDNLLSRLLSGYLGGAAVKANRRLRGAPTTYADAVRVVIALVKQISCGADNWGIMHYCSGDVCTQEEFAEQLLQLLIQQQLLTAEPSLTIVDEDPVNEPLSAILSCRQVRDCFGVQQRSWRPSLLPLVKQWLHNRADSNAPA